MAGRQVYKFTDWRIIWFYTLTIEPEGDNHQKENGAGAKFLSAGESHKITDQAHFSEINSNHSNPFICLIIHTNCAIVAACKYYWVQPLTKRESVWLDNKIPVSDTGDRVFFLDILLKPAICAGCRFWQEICTRNAAKFGADLEHIITLNEFLIVSINPNQTSHG